MRPAARSDVVALNAIYNWYVAHSPATFDLEHVSAEQRLRWLAEHEGGRHLALVAVDGGQVLGFASSSRYRLRPAYDPSLETSVYVEHTHHSRGIGTRLYAALFDELAGQDVHRAYAGIVLPNPGSVALHLRFGFRQVGHFSEQGRKFGRYWDVAWFERSMPGPA